MTTHYYTGTPAATIQVDPDPSVERAAIEAETKPKKKRRTQKRYWTTAKMVKILTDLFATYDTISPASVAAAMARETGRTRAEHTAVYAKMHHLKTEGYLNHISMGVYGPGPKLGGRSRADADATPSQNGSASVLVPGESIQVLGHMDSKYLGIPGAWVCQKENGTIVVLFTE